MEAPNIDTYFEMINGDSQDGYVDTHKVIHIMAEMDKAWKEYVIKKHQEDISRGAFKHGGL